MVNSSRNREAPFYVAIDSIRVSRKKIDKLSQAKIQRYMLDYERGDDFPPIVVEDCGGFYTVRDGRHRYQAQLRVGYTKIEVKVH